jgi:hypothetical protein
VRDERSFMLSLEVDEIDESASWAVWEALAAELARVLPARALTTMLHEFQHRLLERVCGARWQPQRDLPAPFVCPNDACGAAGDFARKGTPVAAAQVGHRGGGVAGAVVAGALPGVSAGVRAAAGHARPGAGAPH